MTTLSTRVIGPRGGPLVHVSAIQIFDTDRHIVRVVFNEGTQEQKIYTFDPKYARKLAGAMSAMAWLADQENKQ